MDWDIREETVNDPYFPLAAGCATADRVILIHCSKKFNINRAAKCNKLTWVHTVVGSKLATLNLFTASLTDIVQTRF